MRNGWDFGETPFSPQLSGTTLSYPRPVSTEVGPPDPPIGAIGGTPFSSLLEIPWVLEVKRSDLLRRLEGETGKTSVFLVFQPGVVFFAACFCSKNCGNTATSKEKS